MQNSLSHCKILNPRTAQIRFLTLAGLILTTILLLPSASEAMLPFYANDWESQLFDGIGAANFPVVSRIIEEHALLYSEGGNKPGDAAFFENPEKIFYFGTSNVWFGGLPGDFPNAREVLFDERNFYHSTEPSSLVAWWNGTTVEVKWDWDGRFTRREQCPAPFSMDQAQRYRLWRFDSPVDSTLVSDAIEGVNYYSDNPPDPLGDYSYRVETYATEGNNLGTFLEYTPYGEAAEVSGDSGPHFFHKRLQIQESFYHNFACHILEDEDPLVFSIQFGVEGSFQVSDLELQVCTDFDPDPENSVGPVFLESDPFEFTLVDDCSVYKLMSQLSTSN